ncbi:hypothetical protein G419_13736 [Rhodococcus triatomae BKS 15-14]|nr:hypothetical protein G419_13736 [Rhodococcus triatomae BKS 15-14]
MEFSAAVEGRRVPAVTWGGLMSSRSGRRLLASVAVAAVLAGGVGAGAGTAAAQSTDLSSSTALTGSAELTDPETGEETLLGSTASLADEAVDFFLLGGLLRYIDGVVHCIVYKCDHGYDDVGNT